MTQILIPAFVQKLFAPVRPGDLAFHFVCRDIALDLLFYDFWWNNAAEKSLAAEKVRN